MFLITRFLSSAILIYGASHTIFVLFGGGYVQCLCRVFNLIDDKRLLAAEICYVKFEIFRVKLTMMYELYLKSKNKLKNVIWNG